MRDAGSMGEFHSSLRTCNASAGVCPHARLHVTRVCVCEHSGEIWFIVMVMTFTGSNTEAVDVQLPCNACYYTALKGHSVCVCEFEVCDFLSFVCCIFFLKESRWRENVLDPEFKRNIL